MYIRIEVELSSIQERFVILSRIYIADSDVSIKCPTILRVRNAHVEKVYFRLRECVYILIYACVYTNVYAHIHIYTLRIHTLVVLSRLVTQAYARIPFRC